MEKYPWFIIILYLIRKVSRNHHFAPGSTSAAIRDVDTVGSTWMNHSKQIDPTAVMKLAADLLMVPMFGEIEKDRSKSGILIWYLKSILRGKILKKWALYSMNVEFQVFPTMVWDTYMSKIFKTWAFYSMNVEFQVFPTMVWDTYMELNCGNLEGSGKNKTRKLRGRERGRGLLCFLWCIYSGREVRKPL